MPRPTNKAALLELSEANYTRLINHIAELTVVEQVAEFPPGTLNRNIRDVLAHLHHWHIMFLGWYEKGMAGSKVDMPSTGYTWKDLPALNRKINEEYQSLSLDEVSNLFGQSYKKVATIINKHSDQELFEKRYYKWTGTTSLGAYLVSATSSHYDWGYKLIKKAKSRH